ncbi:MAG: hypothetical protein ACT4P9_03510 [Betaproteobacteria bacterium]
MAASVWTICYSLDGARPDERARYLDWFHGMHIPEKLARTGYAWAAHYAALDGSGRYLALFGTEDARTFLDPTPGQLKTRQDPLTREMVTHRRDVTAAILVEVLRDGHGTRAPGAVRLSALESADDAAVASMVQDRLPALAHSNGCRWASLLVPVLGAGRHFLLEAWDAADSIPAVAPGVPAPLFAGTRIDAR